MKLSRAALTIALLSGCSSLRPVVDQTRYFLLTAQPQQELVGKSASIGLNRVDLPEYLRRREIAWTSGDQEIHYGSNLQWAEPLDKMIGHVLASDVGAMLAPNYRRSDIQAEVTISFTHFESNQFGLVTLEATWTVRYSSGNVTRHKSKLSSNGPVLLSDPAGAAAELSRALSNFGTEIAQGIQSTP